jgi:hypothetical protein
VEDKDNDSLETLIESTSDLLCVSAGVEIRRLVDCSSLGGRNRVDHALNNNLLSLILHR